jgi:hypothetical protein
MAYADPMSRVPFFMFQDREHGEDAEASKEKGYQVPKMVTFILITPHGHKGDPLEFFADEFIERKSGDARKGMYDPQWVAEFKAGLAAFREGKVLPRNGTPLATWERILKSRREQLAPRFPTVEDLAAVPDSSLGDIGMDGRVLRDMARGDIKAKTDLSPVVKELADANETIRRQQEQIDTLLAWKAKVDAADDKPTRGRPRRETAEA